MSQAPYLLFFPCYLIMHFNCFIFLINDQKPFKVGSALYLRQKLCYKQIPDMFRILARYVQYLHLIIYHLHIAKVSKGPK